jgi:hypothetical protein
VDADQRFAELARELTTRPGVEPPGRSRGFGATALKVDGSIFAMLMCEHLVLKLPAATVAALIDDGTGGPFGTGKRRPMREWVTVLDEEAWWPLAQDALEHVRARQS